MPRNRPLLALGLTLSIAGACSRVPAQPSEPQAERSVPAPRESSQAAAADGPCVARDVDLCVAACNDPECMAWCSGSACVAAMQDTVSCRDAVQTRADSQAGPQPPPPSCTDDCTDADTAAYTDWNIAREDALNELWEQTCQSDCTTRFEGEDATLLCRWDPWRFDDWAHATTPRSADPSREIEKQIAAEAGVLGALMGTLGSTVRLAAEQPAPIERRREVAAILGNQNIALDHCVPEGETDASARVEVEFDDRGGVESITDEDGEVGSCVTQGLRSGLRLPSRVAMGLGPINLEVTAVRVQNVFGEGLDDGWGNFDDMGGLSGQTLGGSGDSYGGLGSGGAGRGGGGTAEGLGGLGSQTADDGSKHD